MASSPGSWPATDTPRTLTSRTVRSARPISGFLNGMSRSAVLLKPSAIKFVTKGNGWIVRTFCQLLPSRAPYRGCTESAHRLALSSLNCISYAKDGCKAPLAALASAVMLEVIANSALSRKLIFSLKNSVSRWCFPGLEILAELPLCQND